MARKATGQIIETKSKAGSVFAIRFRAYGRRHFLRLGPASAGWSRASAEEELGNVLADVRRGLWRPPVRELGPIEPPPIPTFHAFASEWFEGRRVEGGRRGQGLTPAGEADLRWQLEVHLLPAFANEALTGISVEDVDRFRRGKVTEGRLSSTSINKCLACLSAILELAVEYGHIARNPAKGPRRRLPASKPRRTYLDRADAIAALLDAAAACDREGRTAPFRRALLAVLVLGGLRIDEALSLKWQHVDLSQGRLRVSGTKTDAAERTVDLLPLLREALTEHSASARDRGAGARVFSTTTGGKLSASNVRRRVLAPAVARASAELAGHGLPRLPEGLTPHSLRRSFASVLVALGEDPAVVMEQMGHTSPNLTLSLYARAMQRRDGERERLKELVGGRGIGLDAVSMPAAPLAGDEHPARGLIAGGRLRAPES